MKIKWSDWELQKRPWTNFRWDFSRTSPGPKFWALKSSHTFRSSKVTEFVWLTASLAQVIQAKKITSSHNFLLSIVWNHWASRTSADALIAATRWIKACWMSRLRLKAGVVSLPTLQTLWKVFAMIAGRRSKSSGALRSFVPVCRHLKKTQGTTVSQPLLSLLYNTSLWLIFFPFAELKRLSL